MKQEYLHFNLGRRKFRILDFQLHVSIDMVVWHAISYTLFLTVDCMKGEKMKFWHWFTFILYKSCLFKFCLAMNCSSCIYVLEFM